MLVSSIVIVMTVYILFEFIGALQRLDVVEADRDRWQRPSDVLQALDLHPGGIAVDLRSGAGYFALKIASVAGSRGEVLAVDIRKLSLFFLRIRVLRRNHHNIRIVVGEIDNPFLPTGRADSVLICNTYHEFSNPRLMLSHSYRALRPGWRLVIVDRGPPRRQTQEQHHTFSLPGVEAEVLRAGFTIISRQAPFIELPDDDP